MTTPQGEIPAHHRLDVEDSDQDYEKALLGDWNRVDTPGESRSPSRPPSKPKLRPAARKASLGARLKAGLARTVRSKSADKTRERSAEKSPSPRAHRHRSPEAYSVATDHKEKDKQTGALLKGQAAGPKEKDKRTLASLKEQAAELEEILLHYLDPSSLPTEGSKATKAYWVSRIQMLEEELVTGHGGRGSGAGQAEFEWRGRLSPLAGQSASEDQGKGQLDDEFYDAYSHSESEAQRSTQEAAFSDGPQRSLPHNVQQVFRRPPDQHHDQLAVPALHVQMENPGLDASSPGRREGGDGTSGSVEKEPEMVDAVAGKADGELMGAHRRGSSAVSRPETFRPDEGEPLGDEQRQGCCGRPSRGLTQKLKRGVATGVRTLGLLTMVASWQMSWNVLEIFPTGRTWEDTPAQRVSNGPLCTSRRPLSPKESQKIIEEVVKIKPDVLILAPPVGPRSSWPRGSSKDLMRQKACYWPMWHMIFEVWKYQQAHRRLVMIQFPAKATVPGPDEMREMQRLYRRLCPGNLPKEWRDDQHQGPPSEGRDIGFNIDSPGDLPEEWQDDQHLGTSLWVNDSSPDPLYQARVDLCAFGLCDSDGRPCKRGLCYAVNDPFWCGALESGSRCPHGDGGHVAIGGKKGEAGGEKDSQVAEMHRWPSQWTLRVLSSAQKTLNSRSGGSHHLTLHQECLTPGEWEAVPVEIEMSPEAQLRQRLGEVSGQQFDYIYFEGGSGALPRQLRSTLAKLHVTLGHISGEKLKRMLHLNGAKDHILKAVSDMRCQVCQAVTAPTPAPKAAFERPQRFNERVVTDVFFVWDSRKEKFAVVHAVDAFSLYQVATLLVQPQAQMVASFLRNSWIGVFGPPEVLMSDAGTEYAAETEELLRSYDVHHEMVPPSAKWRMGLAERHGAVLKLLVMKTVHATTAKGYHETKECLIAAVAARNRQTRVGGFSPVQIVLGKDLAIPSSILDQIGRGHFKYVLNQDLAFHEARHRNEQIRFAAEQAFIWADSHETLRKALNAKTRHPRHEMLFEGAMIYFYDPPNSRKGLPRRLQDQVSWMGPGVVAALERRDGAIKRVWVRYRNKLKGLPLEYVRLAALEEVEATKVCQEALKEVEKELEGGRPEIENMEEPEIAEPRDRLMEFSDDEEPPQPQVSALDDVPMQFHRDTRGQHPGLPEAGRQPKKVRFDEAKKNTEEHLSKMKAVLRKYEPRGRLEENLNYQEGGASSSSAQGPAPSPPAQASHRGHGVFHMVRRWHLEEATRSQRKMIVAARRQGWDVHGLEVVPSRRSCRTK